MDDELHQFQRDLLASVHEMNASRTARFSANVSLSATHFKNVSLKSENCDTLETEQKDKD